MATLALSVVARAAVPPLLNYQGVLQDTAGDPVPDGNYSVTFRVWDAETSGVDLWKEGRLVTVQDGLFTVLLGSIIPIPDTLFSRPDRWIGIQVGLDPEMLPRQRLVSVPFAWHSLASDKSDTSAVARKVDTSGYSAYQDLLSEGKIGDQAGQVAAGDHSHARGNLNLIIDTIAHSENLTAMSEVTVKSITLPAGSFGSFVRVEAVVTGCGTIRIRINDQLVYIAGLIEAVAGVALLRETQTPEMWMARSEPPNVNFRTISISSNAPLTISVSVEGQQCTATVSTMTVEYDGP